MDKVFLASAVAAALSVAAPFASGQSSEAVAAGRERLAAASVTTPQASGPDRAAREGRAFRNASDRVEARIAYMRTALKISDAQQPQWEGFANVLRKHSGEMDQRMQERRAQRSQGGAQRPDSRNVSAIDRLERKQQRMTQRSARLSEVIAAARPLYASFSPEQKQVADDMIARQDQRSGKNRQHHRGTHRGA